MISNQCHSWQVFHVLQRECAQVKTLGYASDVFVYTTIVESEGRD